MRRRLAPIGSIGTLSGRQQAGMSALDQCILFDLYHIDKPLQIEFVVWIEIDESAADTIKFLAVS